MELEFVKLELQDKLEFYKTFTNLSLKEVINF